MEAMIAPPALALLDKKSEVILSDGRFAEVFKTKFVHIILSDSDNPHARLVKLITMLVKIDDKSLSVDDVLGLDIKDANELIKQITK
jgi:hypothetical protein